MRTVLCDVCGKSIQRWYSVSVCTDAVNENINVGDMILYKPRYDICKECFDRIKREAKNNEIALHKRKGT